MLEYKGEERIEKEAYLVIFEVNIAQNMSGTIHLALTPPRKRYEHITKNGQNCIISFLRNAQCCHVDNMAGK